MSDQTLTTATKPARPRRDLSEGALAALLLLPAALIFGLVLLYPLISTVWSSFFVQRLTEPYLGTPFVGFKQYAQLFRDPRFLNALWNTVMFGALTVGGSFLVGIPMAMLAHLDTRWKTLARVAMLLPWAMPPVFTALIFAWLFNGQYGVVNDLLFRLHLVSERVQFLTNPFWAAFAMVVTIVWKTSSFVALIVLGGLQGIPRELSEAAEVDGASKVAGFLRVTLPLLGPALAVAFIFRAISAIQVFDFPYTFISQAAPAARLETLGVYIYRTTIEYLDFGYGATISVALFALSLAITALYVRLVRGGES